MADILVRCTPEQRDRVKAKAKAAKLSVSAFLLRQGLGDGRRRDTQDASTLAEVYEQLLELNQNLRAMPESEGQERAIEVCKQVGREVVLFRLARQVKKGT